MLLYENMTVFVLSAMCRGVFGALAILTIHTASEIVRTSCLKTPNESSDTQFICCVDCDSRVKSYLYQVFCYLGFWRSLSVKELGEFPKPFFSLCSGDRFWNK